MEKRSTHPLDSLHPTQPSIWTGRPSEVKEYFYQYVQCFDKEQNFLSTTPSTVLIGFACDTGVQRNLGRIGAATGPTAIRKQLASFATHPPHQKIFDLGDIVCQNGALEVAQQELSSTIRKILENKHFPIVLGGGHEVAYGSFCGLEDLLNQRLRIGVVNFDAHFDLRQNPVRNSGTPFYNIQSYLAQKGLDFQYLALGIRKAANHPSLFETARELNTQWLTAEQLIHESQETLLETLDTFLSKVDGIYLTVDMDGFSVSAAPGVSAPNPYGYEPQHFFPLFKHLLASEKVVLLDVAEANPLFDIDNRTAKLAATIIWEASFSSKGTL